MRNKLTDECEAVYQNCLYTAEAHHNLARRYKRYAVWSQTVPAAIAAISSTLIIGGVWPDQKQIFTAVAAVTAAIAAVASAIDPLRGYYDHLFAAKNLTALKQDARSLRDTLGYSLSDDEYKAEVRTLHTRYNELLKVAPPTDDNAFEKARKKIKSGIHDLDEAKTRPIA